MRRRGGDGARSSPGTGRQNGVEEIVRHGDRCRGIQTPVAQVQKAADYGVARLQPLLTERSVVRLDAQQAERERRHWRAIAIGACEQCGRNRLPELSPALTLAAFLEAQRATARQRGTRVCCSALTGSACTKIGLLKSVTLTHGKQWQAQYALEINPDFRSSLQSH